MTVAGRELELWHYKDFFFLEVNIFPFRKLNISSDLEFTTLKNTWICREYIQAASTWLGAWKTSF